MAVLVQGEWVHRACLTAALAAAVSSLAHAAVGLADLNSDDPHSVGDYLAVLVFSAALIGAAVAFALLRRLGAGRLRRAWSLGLALAAGGGAVAGVGNLGRMPSGSRPSTCSSRSEAWHW